MRQDSTTRQWSAWQLNPVKIVANYAVFGVLWVLFSDSLLHFLVADPATYALIQTLKGWFYVLVTAGTLYALVSGSLAGVRRSEQALRESEERYRLVVEMLPDTIAVHREGRIVFVNHAGAELLGAKRPDDIVGRPLLAFVHHDYRQTVRERIRQMTEEGTASPLIEEEFIKLDGTYVDVEVVAAPLSAPIRIGWSASS